VVPVEIDAVILLHCIDDPSQRFKSFSEQAFPGTIDVMPFWLRKLLDGLQEQVMLPEVIETTPSMDTRVERNLTRSLVSPSCSVESRLSTMFTGIRW
jgi:hypothetical protein